MALRPDLAEKPGYIELYREFIRSQIHSLIQQLADNGEESFIMCATVSESRPHVFGSEKGLAYMEEFTGVQKGFIPFLQREQVKVGVEMTRSPRSSNEGSSLSFHDHTTTSSISTQTSIKHKPSKGKESVELKEQREQGKTQGSVISDFLKRVPKTENDSAVQTSFNIEETTEPRLGSEENTEVELDQVSDIVISNVTGGVQDFDNVYEPNKVEENPENSAEASSSQLEPFQQKNSKNASYNCKESMEVTNTGKGKNLKPNVSHGNSAEPREKSNMRSAINVPKTKGSNSSSDDTDGANSDLEYNESDFDEMEEVEILNDVHVKLENVADESTHSSSHEEQTDDKHSTEDTAAVGYERAEPSNNKQQTNNKQRKENPAANVIESGKGKRKITGKEPVKGEKKRKLTPVKSYDRELGIQMKAGQVKYKNMIFPLSLILSNEDMTCKYCKKGWRSLKECKEHEGSHSKQYSCFKCGLISNVLTDSRQHYKDCHAVPEFVKKFIRENPDLKQKLKKIEKSGKSVKKSIAVPGSCDTSTSVTSKLSQRQLVESSEIVPKDASSKHDEKQAVKDTPERSCASKDGKANLLNSTSTNSSFTCSKCHKKFKLRIQLHKHQCQTVVKTKKKKIPVRKAEQSELNNASTSRAMLESSSDVTRSTDQKEGNILLVGSTGLLTKPKLSAKKKDSKLNKSKSAVGKLKRKKMGLTRERKYKCRYCEKKFFASSHLDEHEVSLHTKEYLYKCSLCSEKFVQRWKKDNHSKICEVNYPGKTCVFVKLNRKKGNGKIIVKKETENMDSTGMTSSSGNFTSVIGSSLQKGIVTAKAGNVINMMNEEQLTSLKNIRASCKLIHGNYYECSICGAFKPSNGLKAHIISQHIGDKLFACGICKRTFATEKYTRHHLQNRCKGKVERKTEHLTDSTDTLAAPQITENELSSSVELGVESLELSVMQPNGEIGPAESWETKNESISNIFAENSVEDLLGDFDENMSVLKFEGLN